MKITTTINELKNIIRAEKENGLSVGFVPTMGYLHEGHLTLVSQAKQEQDLVVMSIFVNPLQFGPNEDFDSYPRDFERDEALAREVGVDILFYPSVEEMYPKEPTITMTVQKRVNVLCGKKREGHFDGVVTVVSKLFNIVEPDVAYFGLKDAQQVAVIQGLVDDLSFSVEIRPVPTVREDDGLAKSSRNVRLTEDERKEAPIIYQTLLKMQKQVQKNNMVISDEIAQLMMNEFDEGKHGTLEYIEIYSYPELESMKELKGKIIIAAAVQYKNARLIDNVILTVEENE
ncbi:pantoate--beta-alanine ligase [Mangrovibacillus cuniculi]|uniref:Pantothenate synthetase n=1 Tax=Mangrovibacillus cuniculi TaxID=2593652 RepID=A0A7S8CB04_9BACI|nr:pantoate--beta-alanine ligase [Mangrovibacillus cuniculi]QPC46675.1 pantoate--beta-alanine ligase [Mangrovibacillus cuniculi]